jgi:O-antigen/teichoic acid export membrane protein
MFGVLAGLGLGLTTTKHVAEFRTSDPDRAGRVIGLTSIVAVASGGLISILGVCLAPTLSVHILNAPHLVLELRIGLLLLLLNALNGIQTGTLSGFEAFKEIATSNLVRGVLSFPLLILGVWEWQLPGAVWGLVAAGVLGWISNNYFLRKKCRQSGVRVRFYGSWSEGQMLWDFSLPALLADVAAGPAIWVANTFLVNQKNGYAEMGLFSAANQWRTALMFVPNILLQVTLPLLSSLNADESDVDGSRFSKTFEITQTVTLAVVFPLGIILMYFSNIVISLYGPEFRNGVPSLIGVACTVMIMAVGAATGPAMQALGRMWLVFVLNLLWGVVMVALVFVSAPWAGALSLAYAPAISYAIMSIVAFVYIRAQLERGALRRALLAISFAFGTALLSATISSGARKIVFVPVFVACCCLTLTAFTSPNTRRILFSIMNHWRKHLLQSQVCRILHIQRATSHE